MSYKQEFNTQSFAIGNIVQTQDLAGKGLIIQAAAAPEPAPAPDNGPKPSKFVV
jgi:hypothetical protein